MTEAFLNNPLNFLGQIFNNWWWLFLPLAVFPFFKNAWLWVQREAWEKKQKYKFVELIIPNEIEKPLFIMEQVFANIWPIHSSLEGRMNLKKKFWHGRKPDYFTIEIVSNGPSPRFFLRMNDKHRDAIEAAFFAQYPEMELHEVDDSFMKEVPWNLPDKRWDMYGFDEVLLRSDAYPIKTYNQFFETKPENTKEEKRVDPINTLVEAMRKLKTSEKAWIQIRLEPVSEKESDHIKRGKALVNKLVNRKSTKGSGILGLLFSFQAVPKSERELIPPEMKLTPREREIVQLVENKIGKYAYKTNIRCIFFGEKATFDSGRKSLLEEYFSGFSMPDINTLKKFSTTKTKIQYFFIKRRTTLRKRRMFFRYLMRETTLYPRQGGTYILNIEELATLFHPPIHSLKTAALLQRTMAKKGESPENLPIA